MENRSKKIKIQLPDCILSQIYSKLGLKDLVKTSALSKLWRHEWQLRKHLNFDRHDMFDHKKVKGLPKTFALLQGFQSEYVTRLDQFMLHYQGDMIDSIRVNCPLSYEHSDVIGRLISKGIAKGAKRIELLLSYQNSFCLDLKPFEFSFDILSGTDTLTYLHLQNCYLKPPMEFSGLKNLRTLVLQLVDVTQNWLEGLLSNCIYLVNFTLDTCEINSDLKIIGPTLFRLKIINCCVKITDEKNIHIIASNLSSIEYSCNGVSVHTMNIEAHMLSKFSFRGWKIYEPVGFSGLKNVTTIVIDGVREILHPTNIVSLLFSECLQLEDVTFKNCKGIDDTNITSPNLRHLKIIDCGSTQRIDINALNLASFEYSGHTRRNISVTAPMLSRVFWNAANRVKDPHPFGPITIGQSRVAVGPKIEIAVWCIAAFLLFKYVCVTVSDALCIAKIGHNLYRCSHNLDLNMR
ncbi:hypothetical protein TSUD_334380 [Trifolium subterraneum]|uniref:F-box domain-containing protein n=1 Tax=Trifolium subterraneum TaxID=3900 RepID=A0A2Z6MJ63_TRISU|nr:hypothetical protein TSUD_334380 [Trifolium subterraneum]